jgi:hypothetical protein
MKPSQQIEQAIRTGCSVHIDVSGIITIDIHGRGIPDTLPPHPGKRKDYPREFWPKWSTLNDHYLKCKAQHIHENKTVTRLRKIQTMLKRFE